MNPAISFLGERGGWSDKGSANGVFLEGFGLVGFFRSAVAAFRAHGRIQEEASDKPENAAQDADRHNREDQVPQSAKQDH